VLCCVVLYGTAPIVSKLYRERSLNRRKKENEFQSPSPLKCMTCCGLLCSNLWFNHYLITNRDINSNIIEAEHLEMVCWNNRSWQETIHYITILVILTYISYGIILSSDYIDVCHCVLCLIVVTLSPGKSPFEVKLNRRTVIISFHKIYIKAMSHCSTFWKLCSTEKFIYLK
jgi:hypothetical protein